MYGILTLFISFPLPAYNKITALKWKLHYEVYSLPVRYVDPAADLLCSGIWPVDEAERIRKIHRRSEGRLSDSHWYHADADRPDDGRWHFAGVWVHGFHQPNMLTLH